MTFSCNNYTYFLVGNSITNTVIFIVCFSSVYPTASLHQGEKNYSIETRFRSLEDLRYGVPKIEILTKYGITDERILLRWKGDFENRVYTEAALRKVSENLQTTGGG